MRILLCAIHERVVGGVETYLRELMAELPGRGHECRYAYEVVGGSGRPVARPEHARPLSEDPARDARAFQPDVILQSSLRDPRAELSLTAVAPVAFYAHAYGGMCISGTRRFAMPGKTVCHRVFGAACWGPYFVRRCGGLNPVTAVGLYRENRLRTESLRRADVVLCASRYMQSALVQHGIPDDRLRTIPYFVPSPATLSSPSDRLRSRRLLFLGRLTELKGWPELLQAMNRLRALGRSWKLVLAGDGPDRDRLLQAARVHGLEVEHHAWLDPDERDRLIAGCTLLVLPSTWPEPFGLVGLEAGRLGVPTVAFDVGGVRDWLSPGVSGEVAPPSDARAFAEAVERATSNEAHYVRLSSAAAERASRFGRVLHLEALEAALGEAITFRSRRTHGLHSPQQ